VGNAKDGPKYFNGSWQDGDPEKGMNVDFTRPVNGGPVDLGFDYAYLRLPVRRLTARFATLRTGIQSGHRIR